EAGYNLLVELCEEYPDRMIHGLATHPDTLKKQSDLVRKAVRAHTRASQTIREDGEKTVGVLMGRWGLNRPVAEKIWQKMNWRFLAETDPRWLGPLLDYVEEHLRQRFPEAPLHKPDAASLVDNSFV
ncbi:MAG TPA: hypothetical protein VNL15_08555, partial [Dehalococcoidia bacterium]|nr:hypothetical protein [Dehalococcoidia bacterium]